MPKDSSLKSEIDMIEEAAARMARRLNSTYVANPQKKSIFEAAISSFPSIVRDREELRLLERN